MTASCVAKLHGMKIEDGRVPCLIIDGKELSWEEIGRVSMTFEGFNFKREVFEALDER